MSKGQIGARPSTLPTGVLLLGILLLALALRLARLTFQPLWADEGYSVYFASLDPGALVAATAADIHPPLYYFLLKAWMSLFGAGETAVRLLSVVLAVLTVACVYALARQMAGARVGLLAALLLAVSPFHIYYAQEVRMYALAGLLAVVSTMLMLRIVAPWDAAGQPAGGAAPPWRRVALYLLYAAVTALSLYNLYYAVFLPIAQTLFICAVHRRRGGLIVRWLLLQATVLVMYLPWILYATSALATYVGAKIAVEKYSPLDPITYLAQVLSALAMGVPSAGRTTLALGALPMLGLAALAVGREALRLRAHTVAGVAGRPALLLATLVVVPITLGYAVNLLWPFSPSGFQRLFLYCLPFLLILCAQGLAAVAGWLARPMLRLPALGALGFVALSALCAVALLGDFYLSPRYTRSDYRPLVRDMATLASPNDVVVALYPWQLGFMRSYFVGWLPQLVFVDHAAEWANDPALMAHDLDTLGGEYGRLWFPSYEAAGRILEGQVTTYLTDIAFPAWAQWYGDNRLSLFTYGALRPARTVDIVAGGAIVLDSVAESLEPVEAGSGCIRVNLRWHSLASFPADRSIALRLADDANRTWATRDSAPRNGLPLADAAAAGAQDDHHAVVVPSTTPPGAYRLLLSVYNRANGSPLSLSDSRGRSLGNEVEIAKVIITRATYRQPLQALGIAQLAAVSFGGAPELVGYAVPPALRPGHRVQMDLYWRATTAVAEDPTLFVQVRDRAGKIWGLFEGAPVAPQYPPSRWAAGETLRGQISFLLAPDAPDGEYRVVVGWMKGSGHDRLPVAGGGTEVIIARPTVIARTHVLTLPHPAYALDVRLGGDIQLLGYDLEGSEISPGDVLQVTLYWRALARVDHSYSVFVHLLDEQKQTVTQSDGEPGHGDLPTTSWLPGEVISDTYRMALPGQLPAGSYTLSAGMYDAPSGQRLPVKDNVSGHTGATIDLGGITVR